MPTPTDNDPLDFGPNFFADDSNHAVADTDSKTAHLVDVEGGQKSDLSRDEKSDQATDQAAEPSAQTPVITKAFGSDALSATKAAAKLFGNINGYDGQSETQRRVVRDLMAKQSAAMEQKLQGEKSPDGEDFDSISKLLRRENNRLDTLLEGKEALFKKAWDATQEAIQKLQDMSLEIKRMEEEG